MTRKKALRPGVGAECSCLYKFLHPAKLISDTFPNRTDEDRLDGLVAIKKEFRTVHRRMQECIVFRHDRVPNLELHCVSRYCKVLKEGAVVDLFQVEVQEPQVVVPEDGVGAVEKDPEVMEHLRGTAEDIAMMVDLGFDVDDDNLPAPENIPTNENENGLHTAPDGLYEGQTWGWDGFCERKKKNLDCSKPYIRGVSDMVLANMSYLGMFLIFFPKLLVDIIIKQTNVNLRKQNLTEITYGEFLVFLGLNLFMCTLVGYKKKDFWSIAPITFEQGAPYRLNQFMSKTRFDDINRSLGFTNQNPPSYEDRFWEVRQMIHVWNENMKDVFSPGWITCLDESMSIWHNKWSCPGWVYCPRKPHPFGNEYHDIACGLSNILFCILLVEGKDKPKNKPQDEFEEFGSTTHLLLECCRTIFHTGRVVILDSGFCVLKALAKLREYGVFASALIKKRRYWPTLVKGDVIEEYMNDENKNIGDTAAIEGKLDNIKYNIFCMKDSKFIMKLMSTYGTLTVPHDQAETHRRLSNGQRKSFKYTECFANHYRFRHCVDDHNNLRHKTPAIEENWKTNRWAVRVFTFILAISEVNAFLAFRYFIWDRKLLPKLPLIQFRRKLAIQLINNEHHQRDLQERSHTAPKERRSKRHRDLPIHEHLAAPNHASFFSAGTWKCNSTTKYPQYTCKSAGCKTRIRSYCSCSPGVWLCKQCYYAHVEACASNAFRSD